MLLRAFLLTICKVLVGEAGYRGAPLQHSFATTRAQTASASIDRSLSHHAILLYHLLLLHGEDLRRGHTEQTHAVFGPADQLVLLVLKRLSHACYAQKRYDESLAAAVSACELAREQLGDESAAHARARFVFRHPLSFVGFSRCSTSAASCPREGHRRS